MGFLTKEQILCADDIKTQVVPCPGWGGDVMVRALDGEQRDHFEAGIIGEKGKRNFENFRARFLALSIVDPKTLKPLFAPADIPALGKKSAKELDRVYTVAQDLSGIGDKDVQELLGNSASDPSEDSTGGSLSNADSPILT